MYQTSPEQYHSGTWIVANFKKIQILYVNYIKYTPQASYLLWKPADSQSDYYNYTVKNIFFENN